MFFDFANLSLNHDKINYKSLELSAAQSINCHYTNIRITNSVSSLKQLVKHFSIYSCEKPQYSFINSGFIVLHLNGAKKTHIQKGSLSSITETNCAYFKQLVAKLKHRANVVAITKKNRKKININCNREQYIVLINNLNCI